MNFKEMCRTCLRTGEMMFSIFDDKIEPAKHTAAELLAMFTFVEVDKEDGFPHNICAICLKEIQQAYLFDLKCRKSEIILHQLREIRVNLKKLKEVPKQSEIVSEVAGELESILKEDLKLEGIMNLCDRNICDSESNACDRIRSVEEENANANEKFNLRILEEEFTQDLLLAFKREPEQSKHMKDDTNEEELERIETVSNFQIIEEDFDPQITLKQQPDCTSLIIRNNPAQNELELNQNSSNFDILDECTSEYQDILNIERSQNNLIIKDNENEEEFSEMSSNFQVVGEECVQDFHMTFKSEPELDIGIDCHDEQLKCSDCLKRFESLDTFRSHIVSDHLEENVCKLCNEEFECSQFEHSAKHLPFSKSENSSGEKSFECELCLEKFPNERVLLSHRRIQHIDKLISNDKPVPEFQCSVCYKVFGLKCRLQVHMRLHTGEKPFQCELCPEKFKHNYLLLSHRRTKHTAEFISDDKPVPDFQCTICYKVFGMKWQLKEHVHVHTGEKPFHCELCPEKFKRSYLLLSHRRTNHTAELISNGKPVPDFQCSVCNKVFVTKSRLKIHMRSHTGEKPFQCELCPEKFKRSYLLLSHRRTKHTDELISNGKPVPDFQCSVCYKVFGMKSRLKIHMRLHTGEKPFQCELCPEKFKRSYLLLSHRRTNHTAELISNGKPVPDFQCSVCNKVFVTKSRLKIHMRSHTGEKPFQCELCPEKFKRSYLLLSHRRTKHTDELISNGKPVPDFQCSVCYKVFGMKSRLKIHMRLHTGEKPFQCELCPEKFKRSYLLLSHRRTNHTAELIGNGIPVPDFQCSVCNKVFVTKSRLKIHMRSHTGEKPFQCELCPEKFKRSYLLLSHRRTKYTDELISNGKPVPDFQCSVCYKVFGMKSRLKIHMRLHTGEKPFQCELCPEKFKYSYLLLSHRRTKHTAEFISDDKPVPDFQCTICYKVFGMKWQLKEHVHVHTGEKPFHCELCPEKFKRSYLLLSHRRTNHTAELISNGKPVPDFQCSVCNKVFVTKSRLKIHMRSHTGEKPFHCELCPEKFKRSYLLLSHRRTKHTDELISNGKPVPDFQCSVCYKVFGMKSRLKIHMRLHADEKPFQCELCPEKFKYSFALLRHKRMKHTDELISNGKPLSRFQCSVCCKVYGTKYVLKDHMRVHTGEKPYNCELCREKFAVSRLLLYHRRTKHNDELITKGKPLPRFQCSVCCKVYGTKYVLKDHMHVHTGEKPYNCELCREKFALSRSLLYHRRTKHNDELISDDKPVPEFQCTICYKFFGMKFQLKEHVHVHTGEKPFSCELCPAKFCSNRSLLYHRQTKHKDKFINDDKPVPDFQCSVCCKVFGRKCLLQYHMRVHTGEKPFNCELCRAKFGFSSALRRHKRTKHADELISDNKPETRVSVQ